MRLQVWDTSGQGRFCTIIRSYSRGAQGVLLVYDITSKWSFDGIDRWVKEVEEVPINPVFMYILQYVTLTKFMLKLIKIMLIDFSTLLEFQRYLLVIDFIWLSRDKLVREKQKCMPLKTEWRSLKSALCAISISERVSANSHGWPCTEMVWKGCGDLIKVKVGNYQML